MPWRYLAVASALIPAAPLFVSMLLAPESPQWLAKHGKLEKAERALR